MADEHIFTVQSRWLLVPLLGFVVLMLGGVPLAALSGVSGTLTGNSIFASGERADSGFGQWLQQSSGTFLPYVLGAISFFLLILLLFLLRHLFKRKSMGAPAESLKPAMPSSLKAMKPTVRDALSGKRARAAPPLSSRQVLEKNNDEAKSPLRRWQGKTVLPLEDELALVNQQLAALEGRVVEPPRSRPKGLPQREAPETVIFRSPPINKPIRSILVEPKKKAMGRPISRVPAVLAKPQNLSAELETVERELAAVQRTEPEKASWLRTIFGQRGPAPILREEAKMDREKKAGPLKPEQKKEEKRVLVQKIAPSFSKESQKKEEIKKEKRLEEREETAKPAAKKEA
ncbi:hypothetical protein HYS49_03595, partial [Candidatus Woesearchaeota archaeon]|nr:hypothetical protein [Candidatus Woesearchaeota archaeon]